MAQVFKAWDPNTQRFVALKILHQHLVEETNFRERFSREGQLIAQLHHPNIVTIYDFDRFETDTGTGHYMVMPFVTGGSLKDRLETLILEDKRLTFEEIVNIISGIAAALDYAHAKEMVHRDIKPANILFDENANPLLTDFGLARMTFGARLTQSGVTSGTPAYMSPEQALGEPGDHRSDVYALGIILHEMLTNTLPFTADTNLALLMKHINEPLPSPRSVVPELPPAVEAVVYRATAKEPDSRYQSAGELAEELRLALGNQMVSERTWAVSRKQQKVGQLGRQPWLTTAITGAILVTAIAVLGIAILSNQRTTATPATPVISAMTAGSVPFSTSFEAGDDFNAGWPLRQEGLFTSRIENGSYFLRSQAPKQAHNAVYSPEYYQYSQMIVETDITLLPDSQADSGYGIVFRYQDENNFYVFAINGRQQVSIWKLEQGVWYELRGGTDEWTVDPAVNPPGEPNHLSILVAGEHFTGFVNGARVIDVRDDTIAEGGIGFYLATTLRDVDTVLSEVQIDNFTVQTAVPSMSG